MPVATILLAVVAAIILVAALRWRGRAASLARETAELRRREAEARAAARASGDAIAGVAHELRTPLTSVIGFAELIRDGRDGPVTASQREHLAIVRSSADHLLALIDEMLDTASVEAGHVRLDPVATEPDAVARECVVPLRHLAVERGIALDYDGAELGTALLDPARLRQVLTNLLSNAIKFTDVGGRVTLSVVHRDERLELAVADTGVGIAPADRPRVFDAFVRLRDDRSGSGLGLALTRQIVHAQGGDVQVSSTPGAGSTFEAWVPWVDVTEPTAVDVAEAAGAVVPAGVAGAPTPAGFWEPVADRPRRRRRFTPRAAPEAPREPLLEPRRSDPASTAASARAGRP